MDAKIPAVLILAALSVFFIYSFVIAPQSGDAPVTYEQFVKDLTAANKTYVLMDLRGANETVRGAIMQCGVDLAGSVALAPKNVSVFAIEGSTCIGGDSANRTIAECDTLSSNGVVFHILQGNSTAFYRNKALIGIQNSSVQCSVSEK